MLNRSTNPGHNYWVGRTNVGRSRTQSLYCALMSLNSDILAGVKTLIDLIYYLKWQNAVSCERGLSYYFCISLLSGRKCISRDEKSFEDKQSFSTWSVFYFCYTEGIQIPGNLRMSEYEQRTYFNLA